MKYLLLAMALCLFSTKPYADMERHADIQQFLQECRQEADTPFIKSSSQSDYYTVGKTDGLYHVKTDIQLRYPSYFTSEEFTRASLILEEIRRWIQEYYKTYGLYLDIRFEHAPFDRASNNPHPTPAEQSFVVYIRRNTGSHMKELFWGVNPDWDINDYAKVIAHEFSHLLSLKDEYLVASGAQTQEEEASYEEDSLMKNTDSPNPKLYLRHIKKILAPLCNEIPVAHVAQESVTGLPLRH